MTHRLAKRNKPRAWAGVLDARRHARRLWRLGRIVN